MVYNDYQKDFAFRRYRRIRQLIPFYETHPDHVEIRHIKVPELEAERENLEKLFPDFPVEYERYMRGDNISPE